MIKTNKSPLIALVLPIRANTDHLLGGWSRERRRGCCPEPKEGSQGFEEGWDFTPKRHREGSSHVGCSTPGERAEPYLAPRSPPKIVPASRQQKLEPPKPKRGCSIPSLAPFRELLLPQISSLQPGSHSAEHPSSSRASKSAWFKKKNRA